jgi:hypothetical protein
MIRQYLPNNNENAIVPILQKNLHLNRTLDTLSRVWCRSTRQTDRHGLEWIKRVGKLMKILGLFRYQILDSKFGLETLCNIVVILFLFSNNCPNID